MSSRWPPPIMQFFSVFLIHVTPGLLKIALHLKAFPMELLPPPHPALLLLYGQPS